MACWASYWWRKLAAAGFLLANFALPGSLRAANFSWSGLGDGIHMSDPANWSPNQTPQNGDSLHFTDATSFKIVDADSPISVQRIYFSTAPGGAASYQISVAPAVQFGFSGFVNDTFVNGIPQTQTFIVLPNSAGSVQGTLSVGTDTIVPDGGLHIITKAGGQGPTTTSLTGTTNAGGGNTFTQEGANSTTLPGTGTLVVHGTSSLGTCVVENQACSIAGTTSNLNGGSCTFYDSSTASSCSITNDASSNTKALGGDTDFRNNSTLGSATATNQGGGSTGSGGLTRFFNSATATTGTLNNNAGSNSNAGSTLFTDTSTAGTATINNPGGTTSGTTGGFTIFSVSGTAGGATITNGNGKAFTGNGSTQFIGSSNAGTSIIDNLGGTSQLSAAGTTSFSTNADAGSATITAEGGTAPGTFPATIVFRNNSTANNATLMANGGTNSGTGGQVQFFNTSTGGTAKMVIGNGAIFDISGLTSGAFQAGGLEGAGTFNLGGNALTVGSRNTDATISGTLADGGFFTPGSSATGASLTKVGTGNLTLTGTNNYTGPTSVSGGKLTLNSSLGNAAVSITANGQLINNATIGGNVSVSGLLSGCGTINGTLTVNLGGIVDLTGCAVTINGAVTNNGLFILSNGASLAGSSPSFTNNGTLDLITAGTFTPPPGFMNQGVILDKSVVRTKMVSRSGMSMTLTIDSYIGHTYQLQKSMTPTAAGFANTGASQTGSMNTALMFSDSAASGTNGFYRIAVNP